MRLVLLPFVLESVLKHRDWSVAHCPHCQGLEAIRVEEKVWIVSLYVYPIYEERRAWMGRCDFCGRTVTLPSTAKSVRVDEWSPQSGLAPLLRQLGFTGKVRVRSAPVDERLKSLLAASQEATLVKNSDVFLGRGVGFLIGVALAIPSAIFLAKFQWLGISEEGLGGFISISCVVLGVIGAFLGGLAQVRVKRGRTIERIIEKCCAEYKVDTKRLLELSTSYNELVQQAVARVHAQREQAS